MESNDNIIDNIINCLDLDDKVTLEEIIEENLNIINDNDDWKLYTLEYNIDYYLELESNFDIDTIDLDKLLDFCEDGHLYSEFIKYINVLINRSPMILAIDIDNISDNMKQYIFHKLDFVKLLHYIDIYDSNIEKIDNIFNRIIQENPEIIENYIKEHNDSYLKIYYKYIINLATKIDDIDLFDKYIDKVEHINKIYKYIYGREISLEMFKKHIDKQNSDYTIVKYLNGCNNLDFDKTLYVLQKLDRYYNNSHLSNLNRNRIINLYYSGNKEPISLFLLFDIDIDLTGSNLLKYKVYRDSINIIKTRLKMCSDKDRFIIMKKFKQSNIYKNFEKYKDLAKQDIKKYIIYIKDLNELLDSDDIAKLRSLSNIDELDNSI